MKAARIHRFGPPEVIVVEDIPRPSPATGEVLVRVSAAGVGPWDALIREGKSKVSPPPPLTLGSDLSGVVEALGTAVTQFKRGDEVYGVTSRLNAISGLLESRKAMPQVGSVVPLQAVRTAHEMLAGVPHRRGKIMLEVAT